MGKRSDSTMRGDWSESPFPRKNKRGSGPDYCPKCGRLVFSTPHKSSGVQINVIDIYCHTHGYLRTRFFGADGARTGQW